MDRYTLSSYYACSRKRNNYVVVREIGGLTAAVIHFVIYPDYILIDKLARNKLYGHPGAGGDLVRLLEWKLAPWFGREEIRMEALDHMVPYYDETLGYVEYDVPFEDPEWGELTPKKKRLQP